MSMRPAPCMQAQSRAAVKPTAQRCVRALRAFTLVEVMVVLAIILILATMVIGVSSALVKRAERSQTEAAMTIVQNAMEEWEAQAGRPITFGTYNQPAGAVYDLMELPPATGRYLCVFLTTLLSQNEQSSSILRGIPSDLLREDKTTSPAASISYTGGNIYAPSVKPRSELVDTWGNRVAVVCPGRRWRVGDPGVPDADGTIRTVDENALGVCQDSRICLISSGPDGLLGTEAGLTAQQRLEAIADNIYSYELLPIN